MSTPSKKVKRKEKKIMARIHFNYEGVELSHPLNKQQVLKVLKIISSTSHAK